VAEMSNSVIIIGNSISSNGGDDGGSKDYSSVVNLLINIIA
jgi:hypothetical protein